MSAMIPATAAGASPLVRIKQFCCRQPWTCVAIAAIAAVGVLFALKVLPLTFCLATCLAVGAVGAVVFPIVVPLIAVLWKKFRTDHTSAAAAASVSASAAAAASAAASVSASAAGSGTASTGTSSGPSCNREIAASILSISYSETGAFVAIPTAEGVRLLQAIHQRETVLKPLTIYIPKGTSGVQEDSAKKLTTKAKGTTPLWITETYYIDCIERLPGESKVSLEGECELMLSRDNNIAFIKIARTWAVKKFWGVRSATRSLLHHFTQHNYQACGVILHALIEKGGLADYMLKKTDGSRETPSYQTKISVKKVDGRLVADYEVREQRLAYDATVHFTTQVELTDRGYRGVGEIEIKKIEGRFKPEYLAHLQRAAQE
jgi:hypothetical protein